MKEPIRKRNEEMRKRFDELRSSGSKLVKEAIIDLKAEYEEKGILLSEETVRQVVLGTGYYKTTNS